MAADRPTDFGRTLREARERRGVSLRDIANATKISVAALEALERNDISRLPGGIFSRAFVRAYALQVGLPPEEAVREFIAQFPHESVTAGHPTAKSHEDGDQSDARRPRVGMIVQVAAVGLVIAVIALYFVVRGRRAAPVQTIETPVAAATTTGAPSVPVSPPVAVAPSVAPTPPAAEPTPLDSSTLTVVMAASRPCWVSARVDGERVLERTLKAGDRETLEVHNELVITAGDAGALALTLNGAEARALGKSGEVITARMSPGTFRDYLLNP